MGEPLRHQLAALAVAVGELRQAQLFDKARQGERCLTLQLELLGSMVDKISQLERELQE